ncbi:hypothetical protein L195_g028981 [Trifolium pratense]|uniref:Uncharacterized protein n=1 Tax=Trifolium pratense TaxID=57577 RepID=A0A2K3L3I2_TRIPR|nr:hypothetical protein L195_g028981 [Trifolium pratense]
MIVVPSAARVNFFGGDMIHWFTTNLQCNSTWINDIKWPEFWAAVCFYLWNWRNREYHDDNYSRPVQPVNFIMQRCREYQQADRARRIVTAVPRVHTMIGWKLPVEG